MTTMVKTGWYNGNQKPVRSGYYIRDHSGHNRGDQGLKLSYFDVEIGRWGRYQGDSMVPARRRGFRTQPNGSVWQKCKWQGWYKDANIPDTIEVVAE